MLRIHRNSIRILAPLFLLSLALSAIFHHINLVTSNSWWSYLSNTMIGVMGSTLLSLILAIINYKRERYSTFLAYWNKIQSIIADLSKYRRCAPNDFNTANKNAEILRSALLTKTEELGDIFAEFAFLLDKHDLHNKRNYLFGLYQYFKDMQTLVAHDLHNLDAERCPQFILERVDDVILDIQKCDMGCTIYNRAERDFESEYDNLIALINSDLPLTKRLIFVKTPITNKVFCLLSSKDEVLISFMNSEVQRVHSRTINATPEIAAQAKDLLYRGIISSYSSSTPDGQITKVQVSDASYYYFGYKERFMRSEE